VSLINRQINYKDESIGSSVEYEKKKKKMNSSRVYIAYIFFVILNRRFSKLAKNSKQHARIFLSRLFPSFRLRLFYVYEISIYGDLFKNFDAQTTLY